MAALGQGAQPGAHADSLRRAGLRASDRQFDGTPTLDTYVDDLAAVVAAADLERFALLGISGGPTAIEYAARNPERVSRLVLYGTYARGRYRRGEREEQSRVLIDLMRVGWGGTVPAFRQVFSSIYIPSAGEDKKRWYDEMQQASSTGDMAARLWMSRTETDISDTARRHSRRSSTCAAGPRRALRGRPAAGSPSTGCSLRDARERQPHSSRRRAGLAGVPR